MTESQKDTLYFVEDFAPMLRNLNGTFIALSPEVCYQLDKEGISYQVYEDFYDMFEMKEYGKKYNERLISWIDSFDDYLRNMLIDPLDKKINFVRLYGYYIKNMLDSFIICSKNILSVLSELKPTKITLVTNSSSEYKMNWMLYSEKVNLSSYLLPVICKQTGIAYSVITVNSENFKFYSVFLKLKYFPRRIFNALLRIIEGFGIQIIYIFFLFKRKKLRREGKFRTFLILKKDWLGNFCKDAVKQGYKVLYHTIHGPKKYLFFRNRKPDEINDFYLDENTVLLWQKIGENCIREFKPSKWASSEAGADLSSIINDRFLYFLQKISPIISLSAKRYGKYFKEKKIDYVIGAYILSPSEFGVITTATLSSKVFSVRTEHGSAEIQNAIWHFSEQPADIYVTSSKNEAIFFDEFFNHGNKNKTNVIAGRVWIDRYKNEAKKIAHRFSKLAEDNGSHKRPQKVYYLPSVQSLQRFDPTYPLCWYYRLQRDLCEHFATLSHYHFIVKVHPAIRWLSEPLLRFLKDLKAPNIFYRTGNLVANLRKADRFITDYPSTPTYEARLMGLPVLSLYHESLSIRQTAKQTYGKTLVSFKTTEEALKQIDGFLSSNPKEYIVPVEDNYFAPTLLEILENLKLKS